MPPIRTPRRWPLALFSCAAALVAALIFFARPSGAALPAMLDNQALPSLAPMLDRVVPAVVNISSKTRVRVRNPLSEDPFFRQFFGLQNAPRERIEQSLGSGVIIDAGKGYVLTNNHVIEGADDVSVTLHDGRTLTAKVVGSDPDTDVAVIQIPAQNLVAVPLADSTQLRVGDFVVALGNPFGLGQTATSGIVSALSRTGLRGMGYQNFIQTDASINPGNSGGALVNLRGELVGINSAIYSPSGGNVGIGFAIPSALAGDVMRQLIATGSVKHGTLGISAQSLTAEIAAALGTSEGKGAVVTQVRAGSPADSAGVQRGDVILGINGKPVSNENDLYNAEGILPVGSDIQLKLLRDGKTLDIGARLVATTSSDGGKLDVRIAGADLSDASERVRREGLNGVSISRVAPDSRAAANGLKAGDVIVALNQVQIGGLDDLKTLAARHPRQLVLAIVRGQNLQFLPMQ